MVVTGNNMGVNREEGLGLSPGPPMLRGWGDEEPARAQDKGCPVKQEENQMGVISSKPSEEKGSCHDQVGFTLGQIRRVIY